ncbi:MAG: hypothetical protein PUD79_04000 [Prevotellaceae bacterium]|nr:hypothetical protein [Prevotellaceae bacterium]
MKHHSTLLTLFLLVCLFAGSCVSEEDFPTPADARIAFSADTLDFDTIIINKESPTTQFAIYNTSSSGITITSVAFEGDASQDFLANVDGTFIDGHTPISIDCRGKDSLIAFAQFNSRDHDRDQAVLSEAKLVFTLANGVKQGIVVKGYSQSVVEKRGLVVDQNTTLDASRPIAIYDSLVVKPGATLTIAPGNTLLFSSEAGIKVEGTIKAEGTLDKPIVFRGNRYDDMFKNQPYDRIDNQWQGIWLTASSYDNHFNFCDIHSGNYGIACDASDIGIQKLTLENSIIHNTRRDGLSLNQCKSFIGNSQITNAENYCVYVVGGNTTIIHCTIGWFSPFSTRLGNALLFCNHIDEQPYPIENLEIRNSIVTGHQSDEIFANISTDETVANNYSFYNCLLNTPEIKDNPQVLNNVWENNKSEVKHDGNFINFDYKSLIYDFRLSADSPARFLADPVTTSTYYPLDRLGQPRPTNGQQADAGCYQYVELPQGEK